MCHDIQHIKGQQTPLHVGHFSPFYDSHDNILYQISLESEIVDHGIQSSSLTLCLYCSLNAFYYNIDTLFGEYPALYTTSYCAMTCTSTNIHFTNLSYHLHFDTSTRSKNDTT